MQEMNSQTTSQNRKVWVTAGIAAVIFVVGISLLWFAPAPYKQWGGLVTLVSIASLIVIRALQTITHGKLKDEWIPYIVATFLLLVPFVIFASGILQQVAFIVFAVLVCAATFYWFVAIIVNEAKKIGQPRT